MRIAAAQLNQIVGDFRGNTQRIIAAAHEALANGARLLVTPELSLTGYSPEDLLLRDAFQRQNDEALAALKRASASLDLYILVGHPFVDAHGARCNAASLLYLGETIGVASKRELPTYEVFDEERYFAPGADPFVFELDGVRFGVAICEDVWSDRLPGALLSAGVQVVLAPNASPYHVGKQAQRLQKVRGTVCARGMAIVAANLVGGQDELVFDGQSYALRADGSIAAQACAFEPELLLVDLDNGTNDAMQLAQGSVATSLGTEAEIYGALVLGLRDYIGKNGFPGVIIGLSGGVDSALVLAIAVDALGADKVRTVMMPSPYTAEISWLDAREMAAGLGVRYEELPIGPCFDAFRATLSEPFRGLSEDTTEENLQARIRGTLLMALSNKTGSIVLITGNKSEVAVGYSTLYGDMAGGFAVLRDVFKTMVWRLCRYRNAIAPIIPERIITRPPSAELRADQTDQDSLPPYEILDAIVSMYMEQDRSVEEIVAAGHPQATVQRVAHLMRISEYKRRQSPVGPRITSRAFGRDWRYPITSRFRD